MPTIISHSVIAVAASLGFRSVKGTWKFTALSIACALLPDADVIGYHWLYIPSGSFFGHRGFFHSPCFAALLSLLIVSSFYRQPSPSAKRWWLWLYFFILTASHGMLDALTNGGQGIALLSPLSNHRYFLPWTPIEVSPLGIKAFLGRRGLAVLMNEILWVWLPTVFIALLLNARRYRQISGMVEPAHNKPSHMG